jgi:hypothetical protein
MSDAFENERSLLIQRLRRDRCACLVLAEMLEKFAEDPGEDSRQMDRLYGVAYLLDTVGASVDLVQLSLQNEENPAR